MVGYNKENVMVYIVWEYNDFEHFIRGMFSTIEKAQAAKAKYTSPHNACFQIFEVELDK